MSWKRNMVRMLLGEPTAALAGEFWWRWKTERRMSRRHRRSAQQAAQLARGRRLRCHFGCGHHYLAGWVNIDNYANPPCTPDLLLDLRRPLPFAAATCEEVYSEHFFEHLPYPESAVSHLTECWRVLVPGGRIGIGVPDPEPVLRAYLDGTPSPYFDYFDTHLTVQRFLRTRMEAVNWLFRQGGEHQFIYDFHSLQLLLQQTGFTDVVRREFDPRRDSAERREGTLYVDALKPRGVAAAS